MKHLRVLEQADLIRVRREGRLRWNDLNPERLQDVPTNYLEKWRSTGDDQDDKDDLMEMEAAVIVLEHQVTLPASPERVYRAFLQDIDAWWPDRNLDNSTLILEPFVGGRFYETNEDEGAAILLGFVTCLRPHQEIRFFGPMDAVDEAATSIVRIQLEKVDEQTRLYLTHRAAGEVSDSLISLYKNDWAERLDQHLKAFLTEDSAPPPVNGR